MEVLADLARPFTPEAVEGRTGIRAETIREVARAFARSPAGACYGRVGISTQEFGALSCWLVNALNVITGNLDRPGGSMFTRPAVDAVALAARTGHRGHYDKGRSRVRGLPEFGGEYPVAVLAEEIETPGAGQVRALLTAAGNPVLSAPNGARLARALARLEFMVAVDFYLNETTRHAHLVLPPTAPLEHDHYDVVFHLLAVRNTARYSPALFEPPPGSRHDWRILGELARRVDEAKGRLGLRRRLLHAALSRLGPHGIVDWALRLGPHGGGFLGGRRGLGLARLRREVHGVDLGPLEPCLPGRLYTEDRRIDLVPGRLREDVHRLGRALHAEAPEATLRLIGRRDLRSNNSWMHNSHRLVKGKDRCTLLLHPDDAAARGLATGDRARVRSRVGSVEVPVEVSATMRPGVVSLPHGWGHGASGTRLGVANARPGASLNDLTDDLRVDPLGGTAAFSGVPVEVDRVGERAPGGTT
jgi:anaerobic selenocysteine-containing dehydrogenase